MEKIKKKKTKAAFLRPRDKVLALLYCVIASLITLFENKMGMTLWDAIIFTGVGIVCETLLILLGTVEFVKIKLLKTKFCIFFEQRIIKLFLRLFKKELGAPNYSAYTTALLLLFYIPFLIRVEVFYSLDRMSATLAVWFCIINLLVMFGLGGLFTTVSKWFQYHMIHTARKLKIPLGC